MGLLCAPAGATPNAKATPSVSTVHNHVAILIRSRLSQCGIEAVSEFRRAYSPPCKGGVAAPSKNGPVPKRRRRGGRSRVAFRNAFLKHLRVSDHPVCGGSVASRLFIYAAATPHEEGDAPRGKNSL